jgi:hypothetical protein
LRIWSTRKKLQQSKNFLEARKFTQGRKGISTVYASLIALLIVFVLLSLEISFFTNYNAIYQDQKVTVDQKAQEQFTIKNITMSNNIITKVLVENEGTVELKIRAIYLSTEGTTTFICDPSVYISPTAIKNIDVNPPITISTDSSIIVVTERGTLSKEYFVQDWEKTIYRYDTENLTIGPLRLRFESFEFSQYNTTTKSWGQWTPGWNPPLNTYLSWRVRVTNIGDTNIFLNNRTALSLFRADNPKSERSWYINATEPSLTEELQVGQAKNVFFLLNRPAGDKTKDWQTITGGEGVSTMVFLTFFGQIVLPDGSMNPYGQTIPFEAVVPGG